LSTFPQAGRRCAGGLSSFEPENRGERMETR
jgi:hypothetical protein